MVLDRGLKIIILHAASLELNVVLFRTVMGTRDFHLTGIFMIAMFPSEPFLLGELGSPRLQCRGEILRLLLHALGAV